MNLLQNNRIRLRALEPEDLGILYQWENDPSLWAAGTTLSPYSRYALKEYIAQSRSGIYEQKQLRLMIELIEDGITAGTIDLYDFDPHNGKAGVGILLDPAYRRKGIATESLEMLAGYAFSLLRLRQLYAYIPVTNDHSKALFMRCGFTVSGQLANWIAVADGHCDVLILQRVNTFHTPQKGSLFDLFP